MKKVLIATGIAALAFASLAGAQGVMFSTNLTVGSTGAQVVALQDALISMGYNIPAIASGASAKGYFGAQTKSAVMQYQAARGIPSTGFVGPLTRNALNGGASGSPASCPAGMVCTPSSPVSVSCPVGFVCTPVGGTAPSTGGLAGLVGTISDVDELSSYNNEEVGEGQNDVKVLGMDVEASQEGDVRIRSIKLSFSANGNGSGDSDDLDDYIDTVSIWMGSTRVGSADASSFNEDSNGNWSKTIATNAVIRADQTEKFYVAIDSADGLDSGDIDSDSWSVDVENIRFEDGSGVTTTDSTTGDIDGMDVDIDFASFSSAADTEVKFSKDSSSPDASIVVVDDDSETDGVVLLVGKIKVEGDSDVTIDELPITLTTAGDSVSAVASSLTLRIGGDDYNETVAIAAAQTGSVTFDNLDFTIQAGQTVTFTVLADVNDVENSGVTATDFDEGDYLVASFSSTNRLLADIENEEGDQLTDSTEKSGTITGDAQEFRTNGIGLTLVSTETGATTGTSANDDAGSFKIRFRVTAIGDTVYISSVATSTTYYNYTVDKSGTATTGNTITATVSNLTDTTTTSKGNYEIEEGESETLELLVTAQVGAGGTSGQYRTSLTGVRWDTTDTIGLANNYTSELDAFKTSYLFLN